MQGGIDNGIHHQGDDASGGTPGDEARGRAADAPGDPELRMQQALLQGLAHDLRAPLRSIDSFSTLLAQHLGQSGTRDPIADDHLRRIRDAAGRMGVLIDGLQELASAARAPMRSEPVDLSLLADWVAAELQDAEPARAASVEVAQGLSARGDEHYLKRLLARVLENAWRFAGPDRQVRVEVDGQREGRILHLRVRDHGIGFDMRYADKLFEPFQRLHGPEEGAGAGLGLSIAQCIAHRHAGRIRAESAPGAGSVFHIELPVAEEQAVEERHG